MAALLILFVAVFVTISSSAEISSMLPDNTYCNGQPIQWMCTSNSSLSWRSRPYSAIYDNDVDKKFNVGLFETELLGIVNGTVFRSTAGISTSRDSSDLNGTLLECAPGGGFEGSEAASVNLTIQDSMNISSVCVEEHSEKEIVIRLAGASCVYYYVFKINGVQYISSEKDFFIHQAVAGYYYHVTVSGMSYFNQNFTSISSDFYFGEYMFHAYPIVDFRNSTLYIIIEASIDIRQPQIKSCNVSLMNTDTLNYTIQSCSEALKMVSYKVVPGSYQYIVMIDNIVGRSNFSDIIDISFCQAMAPTFSLFPPTPTTTLCPTDTTGALLTTVTIKPTATNNSQRTFSPEMYILLVAALLVLLCRKLTDGN